MGSHGSNFNATWTTPIGELPGKCSGLHPQNGIGLGPELSYFTRFVE